MFTDKNIAVLANITRSAAREKALRVALLLTGMDIRHQVFLAEWPEELSTFSEAWIVGGDGTLNYFINKYAEAGIPLAIFKGGTGNDFHWLLYGDIDLEAQVDRVLAGNQKFVDAGRCNGRYFLNNLGIGFDARVTKDLVKKNKQPGIASYYLSVLRHILFFRSFPAEIEMQRQTQKGRFFMVSVSNGKRTGGGFYLAPHAVVDDGKLDIMIIKKVPPVKRLFYLPILEKGKHAGRSYSFLQTFQSKTISVRSDRKLHAHMDGEYFREKIFEVTCLPGRFVFLV